MSEPSIKHSLHFDAHMRVSPTLRNLEVPFPMALMYCFRKVFEIVTNSLEQCRKDDSLIASRLLSSSSDHLATTLELLWKIQRNESLVGRLARGFVRHQAKTTCLNRTSPSVPDMPISKNDTQARRIRLGKLSVMWMRLHCSQAILTDLATNQDHQAHRVLNSHFSLSPTSVHRTTRCPYLSRLLGSPSCVAAYVGAAEGFIKIWKAVPDHLRQQPQAQSATTLEDLPILWVQLNDLAQALDITDVYPDYFDLIKSCAHVLICQTLDWTLEAHRNTASVIRKAALFKSRTSLPSNNPEPQERLPTEPEQQAARTAASESHGAGLPRSSKTPPGKVPSAELPATNAGASIHSISHSTVPPKLQESPLTESELQVAPTTEFQPQRDGTPQTPNTPSCGEVSSEIPITDGETTIHSISTSTVPPIPQESPLTEFEPQVAVTTQHQQQFDGPPRTLPRAPSSSGDQSLPPPQIHNVTGTPVPSIPAPDCPSASGASQSTCPVTDPNLPQKTLSHSNHQLTPLSQTLNGSLAPSIPAPDCPSAPGASQSTCPATDPNSSQKTHNHSNRHLTPLSQTLNGSLAPSDTIPPVSGINDPNNSVELSSVPAVELSSVPAVEVSSAPAVKVSSAPAVEVSSAPAVEVSSAPTVEELTLPGGEVSSSPVKRAIQPTLGTSSACANVGSNIQPKPLASQAPSAGVQGSNDAKHLANLPQDFNLRAQPDLQSNQSSKTARHSVGPRMEQSGLEPKDPAAKMTKKRQRRSTDSMGQPRRKRMRLEPIVERENFRYPEKLLKEFRDNPRLSKALEQATEIAIRNAPRTDDHSRAESEPGYDSDSQTSSLLDEQSAELDPALLEKLKANAAHFGDTEDSHLAKVLSIAACELKDRARRVN